MFVCMFVCESGGGGRGLAWNAWVKVSLCVTVSVRLHSLVSGCLGLFAYVDS